MGRLRCIMRSASLREASKKCDVIHQVERLQWRVGPIFGDCADFAIGRIEICHEWRSHCSLPVGVETAPVERSAFILNIAIAAGQFLPQTGWLIRLDGWSAYFFNQETGGGQS